MYISQLKCLLFYSVLRSEAVHYGVRQAAVELL